MLLSIIHQRKLHPTLATWRTANHMLSGSSMDSLISSTKQSIIVLLVGGMISLLLQYPIHLLKGEVVSSVYERSIQPSRCRIAFCHAMDNRKDWFIRRRIRYPNIADVDRRNVLKNPLEKYHLKKKCAIVSLSTSGMLNWTMLAFLAQYQTVCNEPELMRLQLIKLGQELLFEEFRSSRDEGSVCTLPRSHGGHIDMEQHYVVTNRILEHNLLKYPHVRYTLRSLNQDEVNFWNGKYRNQDSAGKYSDQYANATRIKPKVLRAIKDFKEGYKEYGMFRRKRSSMPVGFEAMEELFLIYYGHLALIIAVLLIHQAFRTIVNLVGTSRG